MNSDRETGTTSPVTDPEAAVIESGPGNAETVKEKLMQPIYVRTPPSIPTRFKPGPFPKNTYKDHDGFFEIDTPAELEALFEQLWVHGCIEVDDLPPMDIRNSVHPIFHKDKFPDLNNAEYEAIQPALMLASRFLVEEEFMRFWTHLHHGEMRCTRVRRNGEVNFIDHYIGSPLEQDQEKLLKETRIELERMAASDLRFFMQEEERSAKKRMFLAVAYLTPEIMEEDSPDEPRNDGSNTSDSEDEGEDDVPPKDIPAPQPRWSGPPQHIRIMLIHDWHRHIVEIVNGNRWTPCQELQFQHGLMLTLMHEVAHVFKWWSRCYHRREPGFRCANFKYPVPDLGSNRKPEIGQTWEALALGYVCDTLTLHIGQWSLSILRKAFAYVDWVDLDGEDYYGPTWLYTVLPVQLVSDWFQESTWEAIRREGRAKERPQASQGLVFQRNCVWHG